MLSTPLRSAAAGIALVAVVVAVLAASDRILRLVDRRSGPVERRARRARFKGHALVLMALAIGLVVLSEGLQ